MRKNHIKIVCIKLVHLPYFIICFGDAAAYRVYVYMLYPLQGGRSTS